MNDEPKRRARSSDLDVVVQQYLLAADLYKHEDSLNWQKLNNLFYVTAGLVMIVGFNVEAAMQSGEAVETVQRVLVFVTGLGFLISVAFSFALRSGVRYLQQRKNAVADIEMTLIEHGCRHVVSSIDWHENRHSQRRLSYTARMLVWTPVVLCLFWLGGFLLVLQGVG